MTQPTPVLRCHDAEACALGQRPCPSPAACGCAPQPQALRLAALLRDRLGANAAADLLEQQHARVAELERWQKSVRDGSALLNRAERAEARMAELEAQEDARDAAGFTRGFNAATCVALQVLRGAGDTDSASWREILNAAGRAEVENYARNIAPENWKLCGFAQLDTARAAQGGAA